MITIALLSCIDDTPRTPASSADHSQKKAFVYARDQATQPIVVDQKRRRIDIL